MPNHKLKIVTGDTFGDWSVIGDGNRNKYGSIQYPVRCICGKERNVAGSLLKNGRSKGCGCKNHKRLALSNTIHGLAHHPMYPIWNTMMQRCYNPKTHCYSRYGGRGISVCENWHVFENWLIDMGLRPPGFTIERKDNDGDYCPENCMWVDRKSQCNNRRTNTIYSIDGSSRTLQQWADIYKIKAITIVMRIKSGWPIEKAITTPTLKNWSRHCSNFNR